MKDFIISLILVVVLIVVFSVFGPKEGTAPPLTGFGQEYKSDSGVVVPGNGSEALSIRSPEEMKPQEETQPEDQDTSVNTESVKPGNDPEHERSNNGGGYNMGIMFLYGVAITLLFEIIAIAAAKFYLHVRSEGEY